MLKRLLLVAALAAPVCGYAQGKIRQTELDSGRVEKGRKTGPWSYYAYTPSGKKVLVQRYDHTANQLLYFRPRNVESQWMQLNGEWKRDTPDRPALFIGGDAALNEYMGQVQYPEEARSRNVQGRVVVHFTIDTLGVARDYKILTGIGAGCDEEALRVCQLIPAAQWIPARKNGRAVPVDQELRVGFRLAQPAR